MPLLQSTARALTSFVTESLESAGGGMSLLVETIRRLPFARPRLRSVLDQMYAGGVLTIPIVLLVGLFMGMVLALQTGLELLKFGQQDLVGVIVSVGMCREIGPIITGIILSAAVGSAMAAEIGTMAVSDELTALDVMTVDKTRFLVMPRVIGLAVMCPLLTLVADAVGILGAGIVAEYRLHVERQLYITTTVEALRGSAIFSLPKDLYVGLFKAVIFGVAIAVIGCASGMRATNGARGVGESTRRAVRVSIMLIVVLNYVLTGLFFGVLSR